MCIKLVSRNKSMSKTVVTLHSFSNAPRNTAFSLPLCCGDLSTAVQLSEITDVSYDWFVYMSVCVCVCVYVCPRRALIFKNLECIWLPRRHGK